MDLQIYLEAEPWDATTENVSNNDFQYSKRSGVAVRPHEQIHHGL